jgi:soluble lytic murein transglycosylase-like protein
MMVAGEFALRREEDMADGNKKVYICLLVAFAMLAASPIRAEESPGAPEQRTSVVRADPRTGRLVRGVAVSPIAAGATKSGVPAGKGSTSKDFSGLVEQAAKAHGVDPLLVRSMIEIESGFNPYAVSPKGAEGLMQLTPATARMLGVGNSFDPRQNIEAGVKYLRYLQGVYKDDSLALAAYNAGPGAVEKYKWIPPYRETQNYVYQVGKRYGEARKAAAVPPPVDLKEPASAVAPEHPKLEYFVDENGRLYLKTAQ